ncbi:hypothetical protein PVAP13_4NG077038 [Panicum virgatum]|uniref:Uncharacterized protein n=1 Tax=Panicum virgatum TaxID=38727 RepID=A0A8T0SZU7_PANVG|nr:hypothetical protein PVAP13_4NG077038 [Panicum virgatum]
MHVQELRSSAAVLRGPPVVPARNLKRIDRPAGGPARRAAYPVSLSRPFRSLHGAPCPTHLRSATANGQARRSRSRNASRAGPTPTRLGSSAFSTALACEATPARTPPPPQYHAILRAPLALNNAAGVAATEAGENTSPPSTLPGFQSYIILRPRDSERARSPRRPPRSHVTREAIRPYATHARKGANSKKPGRCHPGARLGRADAHKAVRLQQIPRRPGRTPSPRQVPRRPVRLRPPRPDRISLRELRRRGPEPGAGKKQWPAKGRRPEQKKAGPGATSPTGVTLPVHASISTEGAAAACGSATPACFAAGHHVLPGVGEDGVGQILAVVLRLRLASLRRGFLAAAPRRGRRGQRWEREEDVGVDFVYTTCEAGKRRTVNHTRARARSPRRAGPGRAGPGRGRGRGEPRRGEARRGAAGRTGGAVRVRVRGRT